jgi:hypothetical protein
MPWDDYDPERGQKTWDDYFLGPGNEAEPPVTPGNAPGAGAEPPPYYNPKWDAPWGSLPGDWDIGGNGGPMPSNKISFDFGAAPRFSAPRFTAPTAESVLNEPGYKFGMDEGQRGLEQSAAARGTLRSGGTLKDITAWGQNYAGQHYTDAFNRALSSFDRLYQGELDMYKPRLTEWQTNAAGTQRAKELEFQRMWDEYTFGKDDAFRWEDLNRRDFETD